MVRTPLTDEQRDRGRVLGQALREARGRRSAAWVSAESGVPLDTLRKIERGAVSMPAFFTVAQLARVLELDLSALAAELLPPGDENEHAGAA
ncbi:helix-turn-helix domain-containing protein [Streptodolium elevatio]|uniref:Helix-turn-helix transcriptional regulator n=1 Tax=Streptodolium elevatio TaxID=3157996 RepID=A0ABV3DAW7_9ACTN